MKLLKKSRRLFETLLVTFAKSAIPLIPRSGIIRLSQFLGLCTYTFSARSRNIAAANLNLAFGDSLSESKKREISCASFQNVSLVILDLFWFSKDSAARLEKYLKFDKSAQPLIDEAPTIIVTAHFGNWEVVSLGCGAKGLPMTSIAMPLKNSVVDQQLNQLRELTGSRIASRKGAIRTIIRALRDGQRTALVMDQNTLPSDGGFFVPFFGQAAPVSKAAGALHTRTHAKIMTTWCTPDQKGYYTVFAAPPFPADNEDLSSEQIAERITRELEAVIRKHPHFWLWSYRRWRFFRKEDNAAQYPFYAESYEDYAEYCVLAEQYHASQHSEAARQALDNSARAQKRNAQPKRHW